MATSILKLRSVGAGGQPIPWFTYPAIEYLNQYDLREKRIFEYGGGNSSLYFSARAREVITVESDKGWYDYLLSVKPANLFINLETDRNAYVNSIGQKNGKFDLIVVDGSWRNDCIRMASRYLKNNGVIIVDNSDRRYSAFKVLRNMGFFQIDFSGFSPINAHASSTAFFVRPSSEVQSEFTEASPIGGMGELAGEDD